MFEPETDSEEGEEKRFIQDHLQVDTSLQHITVIDDFSTHSIKMPTEHDMIDKKIPPGTLAVLVTCL